MIWKRLSLFLKKPELFLFVLGLTVAGADVQRRDTSYPLFFAARSNPNEYSVFANSGWDGNWYVGYNTAWVQQLPPLSPGSYSHAYIGAKLGRMKTLPPVGRPPVFNPIPGEIWMAISSTPSWKTNQRFKLTSTAEIPTEGSPEYPLEDVGESQWFWVEIPTNLVNFKGANFLALWSPSPDLISVSSAPVLAAALGGKDAGTWLINNLKGDLPITVKDPPGTPLTFFQPAIALKLIPTDAPATPPVVHLISWEPGTPVHPKPVLTASIQGDSIERAWLEFATSVRTGDVVHPGWKPLGRPLWKAPYTFTIPQELLSQGKVQIRVATVDVWERRAASDAFSIEVSSLSAPAHK